MLDYYNHQTSLVLLMNLATVSNIAGIFSVNLDILLMIYQSAGTTEINTQVAFGQGNSSYARSFPTRKYSAGIVATYLSRSLYV